MLMKTGMVVILQYMYIKLILYTFNLHNIICQLYLNKPGKMCLKR